MKKRSKCIPKRQRALGGQLVKDLAIVRHSETGSEHVVVINLRTKRAFLPTVLMVDVIMNHPHRWSVVMSVFLKNGKTETEVLLANSAYYHRDMIERLKQTHGEMLAEPEETELASYGWIGFPAGRDIEPEEAEELYLLALGTTDRGILFDDLPVEEKGP